MPTDEIIRHVGIVGQMRALKDLASMAKLYGLDISKPFRCTGSIQWTYFAYLAQSKQRRGGNRSGASQPSGHLHRRDLKAGILDQARTQGWDQLVQKLRIVRFSHAGLRCIVQRRLGHRYVGGMDLDGRALVTKSSYRMLHTLYNLGPAPEPNIPVLWSNRTGPFSASASGSTGYLLAAIRKRR